MEFYGIYQTFSTIVSVFSGGINYENGRVVDVVLTMRGIVVGLIVAGVIFAALFILQGLGLSKMAKNRGMKHRWLAFVPFANTYYMGKLAGECSVFGHKMKRAGLYVMIAQILVFVICVSGIASEYVLYGKYGSKLSYSLDMHGNSFYEWNDLPAWAMVFQRYYYQSMWFDGLFSIFSLVYELLMVILLIGVYKKYAPKNYNLLAILSFFISDARYICVFALRNKPAVDYDEYVRKRREEWLRQRQQYGMPPYGNPYGSSYGNPYNNNRGPYGNGNPYGGTYNDPYGTPQEPKKPEEPFGEFSDGENGNSGGNSSSSNSDDLFN